MARVTAGALEASPAPNAAGLKPGFCLGLACLHLKVRSQLCYEVSLQEMHLGREEKPHEGASPSACSKPAAAPAFSQSRGAPCIPVEMELNSQDQKVLPAFAASHEAHTSTRLGQLSILIIFLHGCGKTVLCDRSHHSVKGLSLEALASKCITGCTGELTAAVMGDWGRQEPGLGWVGSALHWAAACPESWHGCADTLISLE